MNTAGLAILVKMGNCMCFKPSFIINGKKYKWRDHIGEGGFSSVDLVEETSSHKLYALKKIICHSQRDEKLAVSEIEYHKIFCHPRILKCVDSDMVGVPDMIGNKVSQVRILLPYYERGTLHEELMRQMKDNAHFKEIDLLSMFKGICEGVYAMHNCEPYALAHRDLKTANILLNNDRTPVIMDLGSMSKARVDIVDSKLARQIQDEASERTSMPYRAPELFNVESNTSIDERTDIWSLGCILYALCFYKSPFDVVYERGDSVALATVSGKIDFPENHPFSEKLVGLIMSLLKVPANERPFVDWVINRVNWLIDDLSGIV